MCWLRKDPATANESPRRLKLRKAKLLPKPLELKIEIE
jgi:hypothetical protein